MKSIIAVLILATIVVAPTSSQLDVDFDVCNTIYKRLVSTLVGRVVADIQEPLPEALVEPFNKVVCLYVKEIIKHNLLSFKIQFLDLRFIFPGTFWCGDGSMALKYDELGYYKTTDSCCRTHDHCPYSIPKGGCNYTVCNDQSYTMSACECDMEFYNCLMNSTDVVSNVVGAIYFDVLRTRCFREEYPVIGCNVFKFPLGCCDDYIYNTTAPQEYEILCSPRFLAKKLKHEE